MMKRRLLLGMVGLYPMHGLVLGLPMSVDVGRRERWLTDDEGRSRSGSDDVFSEKTFPWRWLLCVPSTLKLYQCDPVSLCLLLLAPGRRTSPKLSYRET